MTFKEVFTAPTEVLNMRILKRIVIIAIAVLIICLSVYGCGWYVFGHDYPDGAFLTNIFFGEMVSDLKTCPAALLLTKLTYQTVSQGFSLMLPSAKII